MSASKDVLPTLKVNTDEEDPNLNVEIDNKNKPPRQRSSDIPWTEEEQQA